MCHHNSKANFKRQVECLMHMEVYRNQLYTLLKVRINQLVENEIFQTL